jgi:hypothetical protein
MAFVNLRCLTINSGSDIPIDINGVNIGPLPPSTMTIGEMVDLRPTVPLSQMLTYDAGAANLLLASSGTGTTDSNLTILNNSTNPMKTILIHNVNGGIQIHSGTSILIRANGDLTIEPDSTPGNTGDILTNTGGGICTWQQSSGIGWSTMIPWSQWAIGISQDFNDAVYHQTAPPSVSQDLGTVNFTIPSTGTYSMIFTSYLSSDAGLFEIWLNGIIIASIDMYDAALSTAVEIRKTNILTLGTNSIQFKINGHNAGSSNFYFNAIFPGVLIYRIA